MISLEVVDSMEVEDMDKGVIIILEVIHLVATSNNMRTYLKILMLPS